MSVVGFTLRAEPFLYRNRVKRWSETLHVITMENDDNTTGVKDVKKAKTDLQHT